MMMIMINMTMMVIMIIMTMKMMVMVMAMKMMVRVDYKPGRGVEKLDVQKANAEL